MIPWDANNSSSRLHGLRNDRAMEHWPECDLWGSRPLPHDARTQHWSAYILLLRVPASNVSIVFYIPLQQCQGKKVDSLGVPTLNGYIVFTQFERMLGDKVGFLGMPTCSGSIVFYTL